MQAFTVGDEVELAFTAADFMHSGLQFTLAFDVNALALTAVEPGVFSNEHFGQKLVDEGILTVSWNSALAEQITEKERLFTLKFKALASGNTKGALSIASNYTPAEAYAFDGNTENVVLAFTANASQDGVLLYQNKPNPFTDYTIIGFDLPDDMEAEISVLDISGKQIYHYEGSFGQGYNQHRIGKEELPSKGIMYYQLHTPEGVMTKKMIFIE